MREWAIRILSADTLEEKLLSPPILTDHESGPAVFWDEPTRPSNMQLKKRSKQEKLPPFHDHHSQENRAVCLHRFAGHELLAVEIMAYALLAFPQAPKTFRKGLANTLKEEQEHVRLYMQRLWEMGVQFGDLPLYKHFWSMVPFLKDPKNYVSVMSLTFEMANLDFAPMYRDSFLRNEDKESAALMQRIFDDEIAHVSFGWRWLKRMRNKEEPQWEAWRNSLPPILHPKRARGFILNEAPRLRAGVSQEWIDELKKL